MNQSPVLVADPLKEELEAEQRYQKLCQLPLEILLQTTVRVVAIPIPPTPVRGMMYDPGCYASSTYDNMFEKDQSGGAYKCVAMRDTNKGPVFLIHAPLKTLVSLYWIPELGRYKIGVNGSAFCAYIEFDMLNVKNRNDPSLQYVDTFGHNVRLLGMSLVHRSCHGGSHLVVPGAPALTALLQYESAPGDSLFFREDPSDGRIATRYVRPFLEEVGGLFPSNWVPNRAVDKLVEKCFVGSWKKELSKDDLVIFSHRECIGDWARPYLTSLTRNILTPLGESHGRILIHSGTARNPEKADPDHSTSQVGNPDSEHMPDLVGRPQDGG